MRAWLTNADLVLLGTVVTLVGWLYAALWSEPASAKAVEIWHAGTRLETVPLTQARRLEIAGSLGPSEIEISPGRARIAHSPCQNKVCILSGWLQHAGETTACLPNQVSLRILGADPRYDTINF